MWKMLVTLDPNYVGDPTENLAYYAREVYMIPGHTFSVSCYAYEDGVPDNIRSQWGSCYLRVCLLHSLAQGRNLGRRGEVIYNSGSFMSKGKQGTRWKATCFFE